MHGISLWAVSASAQLANDNLNAIYCKDAGGISFKVFCSADSLWIVAYWPKGGRTAFRAAFSPGSALTVKKATDSSFLLNSDIGSYHIKISLNNEPVLRYTTSFKPAKDLIIPFWPKDILIPGNDNNAEHTAGKIHVSQEGTRSGLIYSSMHKPRSGSFLYFQNLTALAKYCEQTETSCANVVGGNWPEMGFSLPPSKDKFLKAGKEVIISDAFVIFDEEVPTDEATTIRQYLNLLAAVYLHLPLPPTTYKEWPEILQKGLKDLIDSPACWAQVAGHRYFNAYVSDYTTPPEIMVQLAVLLPLQDYADWSRSTPEVIKDIKANLPTFYDEKIGSIMRWLPAAEDKLKEEEEQKKPKVMDSWYLHQPLLNLSRLALKGDKRAEKLFLDSLDFSIKVAHHFNYRWPVFYKMDTLEVIKAETSPGKGGEKDVAGLYTHVMLQAWELTKEKRYLNEAERAAKTLEGLGFEMFYQANNTAFASGALLRLYKITRKELYLELSYLCLAGIFKNVQLWDCNYGYGKHFPAFFALFPLNDAPYTAVYEEQEVFCAFHDYLKHAEGEDILPSVRLLITEYIRYLVDRAMYYYPTVLPKEMLEEKPKIGELDPKLWIALEDLHDGWEKSGSVGQEVYGAGNAFGILPRHYLLVPGEEFMVYVDYPASGFKARKGSAISFTLSGDERLECKMVLVKSGEAKLPSFSVTADGKSIKGKGIKNGHIQYLLKGNQQVRISWA
ncbi:hypothetical protein [Chitinophaga niabensis]|uniref:Uncharacterized protein n=1 Tax=Chitinophaga niabensis TaxID=536979 RepID=A0A1N6D3T0_9BACT|nr:hypothetical protein [Chitinophaga niabensis]SIN65367.1 hypothetical protein SAMN04488055_0207 [Chitinophaga niabensis]